MPAARRLLLFCTLLLAPFAGAATWTLANGDRLTGTLLSDEGEILEIKHAQLGLIKIPRKAIRPEAEVSAPEDATVADTAPVAPKPAVAPKAAPKAWKRQIEFGYSRQSGARSKQDLNLRAQVDGQQGRNTYRATGRVLQTEADNKVVADRSEADFRWRHDLSQRLFAQTLTTYAADDVRAIALSLEQQLGGGYRVLDEKRHKANVGLGAVVQYLERDGYDEATVLLGSFFQDYTFDWNGRVKLTQESNVLVADSGAFSAQGGRSGLTVTPRDGSFRLRWNTAVQSKVTDQMSLNVRFDYDYDHSVPDPKLRADQRITTSLGYLW